MYLHVAKINEILTDWTVARVSTSNSEKCNVNSEKFNLNTNK